MSWLFSRALVEAFSPPNSSETEPCAQLNVMPTQHPFWRNDKTMEPSRLSRFGLTYAALTEGRGAELLMSFREAFPVRTSAPRELGRVLMAREAAYGARWFESFAKFDQHSSVWRTPHCSLLGDLELFSETWPRSGSMRNGTCFQRQTLAPRISGREFGLWPTPTASLGHKGGRVTPRKSRHGGTLIEAVSARTIWATATARDWRSGSASQTTHDRNSRPLSEQVGGLLNPTWVEWLMGWPIGWTASEPLETDKFHEWQQQHSPLLPEHCAKAESGQWPHASQEATQPDEQAGSANQE